MTRHPTNEWLRWGLASLCEDDVARRHVARGWDPLPLGLTIAFAERAFTKEATVVVAGIVENLMKLRGSFAIQSRFSVSCRHTSTDAFKSASVPSLRSTRVLAAAFSFHGN